MSATTPIVPITDSDRTLDGLENLATGQGLGKDSRAAANRRWHHHRRTAVELGEFYQTNWMAAQVVDIPAFEMTRARRHWQIEDEGKLDAIEDEAKRLCLWEKVSEAIKWSRVYGGGALLLGLEGTGELDEPLDLRRVRPDSLRYLHALDARTLIPNAGFDTALVYDPTSPQFMQPEFYSIAAAKMNYVHHTRIIRFPGLPLPWLDMQRTLWWGGSHLERLYDVIADAESMTSGIIHLMKEASVDVIGIKNLMQMLSTPGGEDRVRRRISLSDTLKSIYNSIIKDDEETYDQKKNEMVQGMGPILEQYLAMVSGASGIPVTRLLGTSAKGLSATGEGDIRNFYDMIDAERKSYLAPRLDNLDQVFIRSAIGEAPDGLSWEFGSLWQMDESQVAEIESKRATTAQVYANLGVIDEVVIAKQLKEEGTYVAIDDAYIKDLEAMVDEIEKTPPPPTPINGLPTDPETDPEADPGDPPDEDDPPEAA